MAEPLGIFGRNRLKRGRYVLVQWLDAEALPDLTGAAA